MSQTEHNPAYRTLDVTHILATIARLSERIEERFAGSGLGKVCRELGEIANETQARVAMIEERNLPLRVAVGVVVGGAVLLLTQVAQLVDLSKTSADSIYILLQGIEASMNIHAITPRK